MMKSKTIGDAFEFVRNGISVKQKEGLEGIPITRIETIWNGTIDTKRFGYAGILEEELGKYEDYLLQDGDLLMSHINSWKHLAKNALYQQNGKKVIHGMNLLCLRPKKDILLPSFAKYYFDSKIFRALVPKIANQSVNQSSFSAGNLKKLNIPLPPLKTQQKIAAILDEADKLRQLNKKLIIKYEQLSQSLFLEMFGDPFYGKTSPLKKNIKVIGGYAFKSTSFSKKGIPVIKIGTVNKGYFDLNSISFMPEESIDKYQKWLVKPGDILVSLTGTVGKDDYGNVALATDDYDSYLLNQRVAKIENIGEYCHEFLFGLLSHPKVKKQLTKISRGVRQANISNNDLLNLNVIVPEKERQNQFIKTVRSISRQKAQAQHALEQSEELFNSLLQRAFKGELV